MSPISEPPSFLEHVLHLSCPSGEKKLFPQETHFVLDMKLLKKIHYLSIIPNLNRDKKSEPDL